MSKWTYFAVVSSIQGLFHKIQALHLKSQGVFKDKIIFKEFSRNPSSFSRSFPGPCEPCDTNDLITKLCAAYPTQIPITFSSSTHSVNYLDLTISLNHHTIRYYKSHYQVFQKPHHKYMYPHYSSNHPQHIFSGIIKTETTHYSRLSKTIDNYNYLLNLFQLRLKVLDYPDKLITDYSFPWLSFTAHKLSKTKRLQQTNNNNNMNMTVYYRTKYNKHMRTDKIVQKLLHKYHNNHIPKLSKAYCNSTKLHTLLLTKRVLHRKLILTTNPHTC